jgi:hypothetical protein
MSSDFVRCEGCGADLAKVGRGMACPHCGATTRRIGASGADGIALGEHVATVKRTGGKVTGFGESARQGRAASADQAADGSLTYSIAGSAPQGEEDTLAACRVLLRRLNDAGARWGNLRVGKEPADCVADDAERVGVRLEIQVTRAIVSPDLWRDLAQSGTVRRERVAASSLAAELRAAIAKKASNAALTRASREKLVLALDATRLPGLAFDAVIDEFRSRYAAWTARQGFVSVWLVGPQSALTWRLDRGDSSK